MFSHYHPVKSNNNQINHKLHLKKRKRVLGPTQNECFPRKSLFKKVWRNIQFEIEKFLNTLTEESVRNLINFFQKKSAAENAGFKQIPTALLTLASYLIPRRIMDKYKSILNSDSEEETLIYVELEWNKKNSIHDVCKKVIMEILVVKSQLEEFKEFIDMPLMEPFIELMSQYKIKLMVVIYGLENFDQDFLNRLVSMLQLWWREKLLTGLIIFQSNRFNENLSYYLPPHFTDNLNVTTIENNFQKDQILVLLENLICLEEYQFKLHPIIVQKLMLYFHSIEFSFENFRLLLKTYVLYFFFNEPLSWICDDDQNEFRKQLSSDKKLLNCFYRLFSLDPKHFRDRHKNIDFLHNFYRKLLSENQTYCMNIKILLGFFKNLKIRTESFFHYYTQIFNTDDYDYQENLLKKLLNVSQKVMLDALKKLSVDFDQIENELLNVIKIDAEKLEEILKKESMKEAQQTQGCEESPLDFRIEIVRKRFSQFDNRKSFRKAIKPLAKKDPSEYELWRSQFIENIERTLTDSAFLERKDLIQALFCNLNSGNDYPSSRENLDSLTEINPDDPPSYAIMLRYFKAHKDLNLEKWFEHFCSLTQLPQERTLPIFLNQIANFEWIGLVKRKQSSFIKESFY